MSSGTKGTVFNIQHYSLHDGPGIRTVVFLKGCPLRCKWCSNPESQSFSPELGFFSEKCISSEGCNWCNPVCSVEAIGDGRLNFERCVQCFSCVSVCPAGAVKVYGKTMSVTEVLDEVEREAPFFRHGNGGLTLSGGEPLAQPDFALALLEDAKKRFLHTAIETCGYVNANTLRQAAAFVDHIFFDLKMVDEEKHRRNTGFGNRVILENLTLLFQEFPDLPKTIRTPLIPGVNDSEKDRVEIQEFLRTVSTVRGKCLPYTYEELPYHRFGVPKYRALGRAYELEEEKGG